MQQPPNQYPQFQSHRWQQPQMPPQQPPFPQQQYQQTGSSPEDQQYRHYQNERATLWLFLIWPVGVYLMWKHASWSTTTKIMISALFAVFALLWLMYMHK